MPVELFGAWLIGADLSALGEGAAIAVIMDMQADFDAYHEAIARGDTAQPPRKRVTSTVRDFLDERERERPPGWLTESIACLTAPYRQLVAVEACARVMGRRLPTFEPVDVGAVGDAEVVCFRADAARATERPRPARPGYLRRFIFETAPSGVRLVGAQSFPTVPPR